MGGAAGSAKPPAMRRGVVTICAAKPTAVLSRAIANLLRLASSDLKDAELLATGRHPENAPLLVHIASGRILQAVIASEEGWPLRDERCDLSRVPDENPIKLALARIAKSRSAPHPLALLSDGTIPKGFDRKAFSLDVAALRKLLQDLAGIFALDLLGDGPAGKAMPIRPAEAKPPQPMHKPQEVPAPATHAKHRTRLPDRPDKRPPIVIPDRRPSPPALAGPRKVEPKSKLDISTSVKNITSAAFWALMDDWSVPALTALDLIGHDGGLSKTGKRPRFKLTGSERQMARFLFEINEALTNLHLEPAVWMHRGIKASPFNGATPLAFLQGEGIGGSRKLSRYLLMNGLKLSMARNP